MKAEGPYLVPRYGTCPSVTHLHTYYTENGVEFGERSVNSAFLAEFVSENSFGSGVAETISGGANAPRIAGDRGGFLGSFLQSKNIFRKF